MSDYGFQMNGISSPTTLTTMSPGKIGSGEDSAEGDGHSGPDSPSSPNRLAQQQQHQQQHPEDSSPATASPSSLFKSKLESGGGSGSRLGTRSQGIRKLQKCLSTSISHYEAGDHHHSPSFSFHTQRSVDIRSYHAAAASATTNTSSSLQASAAAASSSSSLTTPFNFANTRQYASFGRYRIKITIDCR